MTVIDVQLIGREDPRVAWPDLANPDSHVIYVTEGWQIAGLENGTTDGLPSVALRLNAELDIDDPDGEGDVLPVAVIAETTLRAWIAATCVLRGRFPEAFTGTPLAET